MYIFFPICLAARFATEKTARADLRLIITSPFYLPSIAQLFAQKNHPTINLINDVFPQALVYSGMLKTGSLLENLLSQVTRFAIENCSASVFLGEKLKTFAERKYSKANLPRIIPVGSNASWFETPPSRESCSKTLLVALYSGAMGHMHETATLLALIQEGMPTGISMKFHSFGVGYERLKAKITDFPQNDATEITTEGALDHAQWIETMKKSPIAIITLRDGAEHVSFPSKSFSALMAGQAIIAICANDSDLAEMIREHDCGWTISPGDTAGLRSALEDACNNPETLYRKRTNAYRVGHQHYSLECVERLWVELFETLTKKAGTSPYDHAI